MRPVGLRAHLPLVVEANLRRLDGLYSYAWSARTGALIDSNTATDGDQEIAFALIRLPMRSSAREYEVPGAGCYERSGRIEAIEVPKRVVPAAGNRRWTERSIRTCHRIFLRTHTRTSRASIRRTVGSRHGPGYALLERVLQQPGVVVPRTSWS